MKNQTITKFINGPLLSAGFAILLLTSLHSIYGVVKYPLLPVDKLFEIVVSNLFVGWVIYVGWLAVTQRQQKQYTLWYWLVPILYIPVNFIVVILLKILFTLFLVSVSALFAVFDVIPDRFFTGFNCFVILVLIYQIFALNRLVISNIKYIVILIITVLAVLILLVESFVSGVGKFSRLTLNLLAFQEIKWISSFLAVAIIFAVIRRFSKGENYPQVISMANIKLALVMGIIALDGWLVWQTISSFNLKNYIVPVILLAVFLLKIILVFSYITKQALVVRPLYILWFLALSSFFAKVIASAIYYIGLLAIYQWLDSLSGMQADAAGWYLIYWVLIMESGKLVVYMIFSLIMMFFLARIFFPRINN